VFTESIAIFVSLKTKPLLNIIGAEVTLAQPQQDAVVIIFIWKKEIPFFAGGFWGPNAADLKRIRTEFAHDPEIFQKILNSESFKSNFGTLQGEQLKTKPKGFDVDHPAIDLLRYKQFLVIKRFTDKEVLSPQFLELALDAFKNMRPFFDYMSEVLTTDANGVSII